MKTYTRGSSLWALGLLLGAFLTVGVMTGCDSVGSERDNGQPTDPTPGTGTSLRGTMQITPASTTLNTKGGTGGGVTFFYQLTGGHPPYYWSNSWPQMGRLTPIDELGRGFFTHARYVVNNTFLSGNDTIVVRDSAGDVVAALFTKTIEEPPAPAAPTVIPSAATITCGASITITATGGNGFYSWTKTAADSTATLSATTGSSVTLTSVPPCAVNTTVTVIVNSDGVAGTSAITISQTP